VTDVTAAIGLSSGKERTMADQLGQCRAYLIAHSGPETDSLTSIARKAGFGDIKTLSAVGEHTPTDDRPRVNFFIVHRHLKPSMMAGAIRSIRLSSNEQIRFAPVILFAEDGPFEMYLNYVHMGFDDVITLPDKQPLLVQRLTGQLVSEQTYFETRDYFGPDRRRMEAAWEADSRRMPDPHSHTRYTFTRTPGIGIHILRTDIFARPELGGTILRAPLPGASALR
jgi:hypothetical protein